MVAFIGKKERLFCFFVYVVAACLPPDVADHHNASSLKGTPENSKGRVFYPQIAQIFLSDESAKICAICGQKCFSLEFPGVPPKSRAHASKLNSKGAGRPSHRASTFHHTLPHSTARFRLYSLPAKAH